VFSDLSPEDRLVLRELGVLGLGLLLDGNIAFGVPQKNQEIFIPVAGGGFVAHHFLRPCDRQMPRIFL
jgi:hypothetical protein